MTWKDWLISLFATKPAAPRLPPELKEKLTERQMETAGELAEMTGVTRDEVFAEAYRRADRITEDYRLANGIRRGKRP